MKRTTGSDFVKEVRQMFNPQQDGEKGLLPLLRLLASQSAGSAFTPQPTVNTEWPPKPAATDENVAASISSPYGETKIASELFNSKKVK